MQKIELVLPAGNPTCLRAAVNNGADAVYFGLNKFNARQYAGNFNKSNIYSAISYCHKKNIKAYITFNTLVKNNELEEYFEMMNLAYSAGADAVIIQDPCFIPVIRKNFPKMSVHLSTQATTTNSFSVPEGVDRIVLPRELSFGEIKEMSKRYKTEIFIHGALCFSYSGQCLFSSLAGGRSGNRGKCAQPCRLKYNNSHILSTMDLCLLEKIPELIQANVSAFKIEGRLRSPLYVATAARIYRKYIDLFYEGRFSINTKDINELKLAFNREFTHGFGFTDSIVDSRNPMNRGLFLGQMKFGKILLKEKLSAGDGVSFWLGDKVIGQKVDKIWINNNPSKKAHMGETVEINNNKELAKNDSIPVYKTSSVDSNIYLGEEIKPLSYNFEKRKIWLPQLNKKENADKPKLSIKVYNKKSACQADEAGADIIYYDILKDDCLEVKNSIVNSEFFVFTPRILSDVQVKEITKRIENIKPKGILVANRGLLTFLKNYEIHLDQSFNCFNDIDMGCYRGVPIISPELNFNELIAFKDKNFIVQIHGDIVLMTSKQKITAPELVDEGRRHFKVREYNGNYEILNCKELGLFNHARDYLKEGIKYFYINTTEDAGKLVRIYKKIIAGEPFDDKKIRKGYTKGHFDRGVF